MKTVSNKELRQFIGQYFSDSELDTFCFDYFPAVWNDFSAGMRKNDKIMDLIGYCSRRGLMKNLLVDLRQEREKQYDQTFVLEQRQEPTPPPPVYNPQPRNPRQIFVSHATVDVDLAHQVAHDLGEHGYEIFITPDSIRPGEKWGPAIERGLDESGIFLVLLTPHAVKSNWVKDETYAAIEMANTGEVKVFLLDVEQCRVPRLWSRRQFLPFRGENYKQNLENLLQALDGDTLARPPVSTPPIQDADPEAPPTDQPSKTEPAANQCAAITKSGSRCRNRVLAGGIYCGVHTKKPKPVKKTPPPRPIAPEEDTFIHERTGLEFVRIPAGEFIYSVKPVQKKKLFGGYKTVSYKEGKIHLPEFWISKTPVPNAVYKRFIDANPAYRVPFREWSWAEVYNWDEIKRTFPNDKADHPVVLVSWYDAAAFCEWAGLELPTEEQWEKAARGTDGRTYPWGTNDPTDRLCNFGKYIGGTTAIGDYSPQGDSPYGCVDMSGNVQEWCLNMREVPVSKNWRALCGGSWASPADSVRVASRYLSWPGTKNNLDRPNGPCDHNGFRVVAARRPPSHH
ncbi:MAG: TIR domain-containing protein [Chloroflexi bacterium]|nr:MAG: TIR domain-containing protein [Chloroflexota bacterium]